MRNNIPDAGFILFVFRQDKQQLADGSYESRVSNYELEGHAIKAIHNP